MAGSLAKGGRRNWCSFHDSKGGLGEWIVRLVMEIL